MATWFTSDLHFGHKGAVRFRPWAEGSVEYMDETIIARWNRYVTPRDTVYVLGDLSFHKPDVTESIFWRLNGAKKIVPGNHDDAKTLKRLAESRLARAEILPQLVEHKVSDPQPDGGNDVLRLVMCHFPMLTWNRAHYGTIHLHGHSHGNCVYPDPHARMLDVGWDAHHAPLSLADIRLAMRDRKGWTPDHHEVRPYNDTDSQD